MIKENELRIGNIIMADGLNNIEVYEIGDGEIRSLDPTWYSPLERLNGIPLTENWLIRFGFEKSGMCWLKDQVYVWDTCIHTNTDFEYKFNYVSRPLIYVHQLQNLYFALTEKEL
jgi:hypothetical protein